MPGESVTDAPPRSWLHRLRAPRRTQHVALLRAYAEQHADLIGEVQLLRLAVDRLADDRGTLRNAVEAAREALVGVSGRCLWHEPPVVGPPDCDTCEHASRVRRARTVIDTALRITAPRGEASRG